MEEMIPFLRMIAENPDDDAPRLVFADWLDEHEHHERAEFIRLQIELERLDTNDPTYPEKTARMRRCGIFTEAGEHPFFDHVPTKKIQIGFRRGFIGTIDSAGVDKVDDSGFDLIPLHTLITNNKHINRYKHFVNLKQIVLRNWDNITSAQLLKLFGPKGRHRNLESLVLDVFETEHLEAGVIPQFDLPHLKNFYIDTDSFYRLGEANLSPRPDITTDEEWDEYYRVPREWNGLPDYLPKNAIPNSKSPLERFIWRSSDDCDYFNDEGWYWRGPTMESLLEHLKKFDLKQVEVQVDYEDHENGSEGIIAAPYEQNPLKIKPSLERITLDGPHYSLLKGSKQKLKELRIYSENESQIALINTLYLPVCSKLESLHVELRGGYWGARDGRMTFTFEELRTLTLYGQPLDLFLDCGFPKLVSLLGYHDLKTILGREWQTLQTLAIILDDKSTDLKKFAKSKCCPNLTTLKIETGYSQLENLDFSFLAKCKHMPHLSLIQIGPWYSDRKFYIVQDGELVPFRPDIIPFETDYFNTGQSVRYR